ncbi:hypothetical protein BBW65_07010 [Helicobacter enhydrae]|uniref:Uncharacterized protein n=1 Tax=Helicobacter enhydrae TaxID=222136 RepID=A0A1B1U712_9HELI|nr:hypothetical protein [Helicobacter enhydrae]ANV98558.1 hypothetical protein BBW65_07010 [Helicobacter enhydrae]
MFSIPILLLSGCAKEVVTIMLPCEVKSAHRPTPKQDRLENLKEIFVYLEELENDLKFCKGELNGR